MNGAGRDRGLRRGESWERSQLGAPDLVVAGGDAALGAAVATCPGALVRFEPDATSDLARTVGLHAGGPVRGVELELDVLRLGDGRVVVNALVAGVAPERLRPWHRPRQFGLEGGPALCVVVAIGQFHHGHGLVPRAHPGDGRADVQEYRLAPGERRLLRHRLATGGHLPHPGVTSRRAREVVLVGHRPFPVELDGRPAPAARSVVATVVPAAYRLLI